MLLENEVISFIKNVVKTANIVNIENVVIEKDAVRAIDEARTVVIYHKNDIPDFPFNSLEMTRTNVFLSRLSLAESDEDFSVNVILDNDNNIKSMQMKGKNLKVDYNCAMPNTVQAPRKVNDNLVYGFSINEDVVKILQKAQNAMQAENVTFEAANGEVKMILKDDDEDKFEYNLPTKVESVEGEGNFKNSYQAKTILSLLKEEPNTNILIGEKGILNIEVNGLSIYVLPQI